MQVYSGTIYKEDLKPIEGYLTIKNGVIKEIGEGRPPKKPIQTGTILPSFINAHTHLGDSAVDVDPEKYSLQELVGPGGIKERRLDELSEKQLISGIRRSLHKGFKEGVTHNIDFREGGVKGINAMKKAALDTPANPIIYGRPIQPNESELKRVINAGDGVGLSSVCDYKPESQKLFKKHLYGVNTGLHAGESIENQKKSMDLYGESEVVRSLKYNPTHLVHLTNPLPGDIEALARQKTPAVVCPRSNRITRSGKPPVRKLHDMDVDVALGTDNAMLCSPSILDEAIYTYKNHDLTPEMVLEMACINGGKIFGVDNRIVVGNRANIMVVEEVNMGIKTLLDGCASIATVVSGLDVIKNV
ncbi:amidohydrolase family protein [Methanonatronarchaeum sp. AMET6-2]|uniref:amidohydrolase family protein n=1 Tax=Methanonatronarchaeum sp. AMET6-2 TaxID=2933293 RepID=UPI001FF62116|nr:amidohydrolase family protein [Methanonatronarchaeum sp. AMET6-2]UOY10235.1 amidohydrolase family protein [Methanonatronarchaeum sp. AMET6-2]